MHAKRNFSRLPACLISTPARSNQKRSFKEAHNRTQVSLQVQIILFHEPLTLISMASAERDFDANELREWLGVYPLVLQHVKVRRCTHLTLYCIQMREVQKSDLTELDESMLQLAGKVSHRTPAHITGAELSALMRWKLSKGKFRPRLQSFVDELPPDEVVRVSSEAYALFGKSSRLSPDAAAKAVDIITQLKGVGPATASAVLSLYSPYLPFMSDEALEFCLPKREYTLPAFKAFLGTTLQSAEKMYKQEHAAGIAHSKQLPEVQSVTELADCEWTPQLVQLALYAKGAATKLTGHKHPAAAAADLTQRSTPAADKPKQTRGTKRVRAAPRHASSPPSPAAAAAPAAASSAPSARTLRARKR